MVIAKIQKPQPRLKTCWRKVTEGWLILEVQSDLKLDLAEAHEAIAEERKRA